MWRKECRREEGQQYWAERASAGKVRVADECST